MSADGSDVTPAEEQAELMRLLSAAVEEVDPVPASALRFAMESRRLIAFEAELAEIVSDSLVEAAATRSAATTRTTVFRSGDTTIRLDIDGDHVAGSIEPAQPDAVLSLHRDDGVHVEIDVNERGFFSFGSSSRRARLELRSPSTQIVTEWLRL